MPLWQWLLDAAGVLLGIVLLYGVALVVRRRVLSRNGGTFELSYRVRPEKAGRGWLLGLGRYSGEHLEWFRIFSLSPRPKRVWRRSDLDYDGRREPEGVEQMSLYPDHVVISAPPPTGPLELAMGDQAPDRLPVLARGRPARADPAAVTAPTVDRATAERAKRAVGLVFVLNGFCFAALVARFPDVREDLDLSNGALGLLLLAIAAGSVLALPSSGWLIQRTSAAAVVRLGGTLVLAGDGRGRLAAEVGGVRRRHGRLPVRVRRRHQRLGRRHERGGCGGRAAHRAHDHAAVPRGLEHRHDHRGRRGRRGHRDRRTGASCTGPRSARSRWCSW